MKKTTCYRIMEKIVSHGCFQLSQLIRTKGAIFAVTVFASMAQLAIANPEGGQVSAGNANISSPDANTVVVNQTSDKAVIDWRTFNIAQQETTQFQQPSSSAITLNRVDPAHGASTILGNLKANGQVWIINAAGIIFGASAHVDVAGLLATTANITNDDFMAGRFHFLQSPDWHAGIVNEGMITIHDAGLAALVAPGVENSGVIRARLGKVALAAGNEFTVDFYGDELINFGLAAEVTTAATDPRTGDTMRSGVNQSGKIYASGGSVLITAQSASGVLDHAINMSGVIVANTAVSKNGSIVLQGGNHGDVVVSGKLIANGKKAGEKGGTIKVLGNQIGIINNAYLSASGQAGGGTILVGGNARGSGTEQQSLYTYFGPDAIAQADAWLNGDGGTVVLWSQHLTDFYGSISAQGGIDSGNGGWVETSGEYVNVQGHVNTMARANTGTTGSWLLDPVNITICNAGSTPSCTSDSNATYSAPNYQPTNGNVTPTYIFVTNLQTDLASSNVVIQTTAISNDGGVADLGDITVAAPITWASANTLTLQAAHNIALNAAITTGAAGSALILKAGNNVTQTAAVGGSGGVTFNSTGTTTFNQANSYLGQSIISSGTVVINTVANSGTNSSLGKGTTTPTINLDNATLQYTGIAASTNRVINLTNSGTVDASGSGTLTLSGGITGATQNLTLTGTGTGIQSGVIGTTSGNVTKTGSGTWIFTGANTYTGTTTISNGILQLGNASTNGTLGNGTGNVINNATLTFNRSNAYTVNNVISGSGTINQSGAGTTTLAGSNTSFSGPVNINTGGLTLTNANALGSGGNILISSGTLLTLNFATNTLSNSNQITVSGSGTGTGAIVASNTTETLLNNIVLAANTTFGGASNLVLSGNISENSAGTTLTKVGAGTLTLSGTNTYSGITTVSAGTLSFNSIADNDGTSSALGAPTTDVNGTITLASGTTLTYTGTGHSSNRAINLTGAATLNASGSGTLTLNANSSTDGITGTQNLTLTGTGTALINSVIGTGAGTLAKTGTGTWTLNGTNTYSGLTTISAGILSISNPNGLGTSATGTTVASGGTLQINNITLANEIITTNNGSTLNGIGNATISTNIILSTTAAARTISTTNAADVFTFSGTLNGAVALTLSGPGAILFNNTIGNTTALASITENAGTGSVTYAGGTVTTTGAQTYNAPVLLGADTTLTSTNTLISFATSAATINNSDSNARALNISSGTGGVTFLGNIGNGANGAIGAMGITTTGTQTFTGTISAASLATGTGATTLNTASVTTSGNQNYNGALTLATTGKTITSSAGAVTFGSTVAGAFTLTVSGSTGVTFNGAMTTVTVLDITGNTTINANITTASTQRYRSPITLGANVTMTTTNSAVTIDSTIDRDATTRNLAISSGTGAITLSGAIGSSITNPTLGTISLTSTGTTTLSSTVSASSLTITGAGGTTNLAGGTITTSGVQTYNNAVVIQNSDLTLNTTNSLVTFASTLNRDTTAARALTINSGTGGATFTGIVGGGVNGPLGDITVNTTGTITLTAAVSAASITTQTGSTTAINGATVTTTGATGQVYNGAVTLNANTTLNANSGPITFNSTLDSFSATARTLALNSSDITTFAGVVGAIHALSTITTNAAGSTQLNTSGITTTGAQVYNDAVTFNQDLTIAAGAGAITFANTLDSASGSHGLNLNSTGATTLNGTVGGTGVLLSLVTNTGGTTSLGTTSINTSGALTFNDAVTLTTSGPKSFTSSGGAITFGSTLTGAFALTLSGATNVIFGGAVTTLTSLDVTGATNLNANITTTGTQAYHSAVTLGANVTLTTTNSGVSFDTTIDRDSTAGRTLTISAGSGAIILSGNIGANVTNPTLGAVSFTSTGTTTLAGTLSAASLTITGVGGNTILSGGTITTTGTQTYNNAVTITNNDLTLNTTNSTVNFALATSTVNRDATAARTLTINAGSGNITFTGIVGGGVNGPLGDMILNSTGTVTFTAAVSAASVTTQAGSTAAINGGTITTTSATGQVYNGNVTINATTTLNAGSGAIMFGGTLDSFNATSRALTANTSGITTFTGAVGGVRTLSTLTTDSAGSTVINNNMTGTTTFTFNDPVTIGANVLLTMNGGSIVFGSTLDSVASAKSLTISLGAGDLTTSGIVGGTNPFASISITNTGATHNITITQDMHTTGGITLSAGNNITLSSGSLYSSSATISLSAPGGLIQETGAGIISGNTLSLSSQNGVTLGNNNSVSSLAINNTTANAISFANTANTLTLTGITQSSNGNVSITNTGALVSSGAIAASGGTVSLTTLSPDSSERTITISSGITTNGGAISLSAANPSNATSIFVNALLSTVGGVGTGTLTVGGGVQLNVSPALGAGNITLQGNGQDLTLGTLTFSTPVSIAVSRYLTVNGTLTTTGTNSNITLQGDSGNIGIGGVYISSTGSVVSSGNITLIGSSLSGLSGADQNAGIQVSSGATIQAVGNISLTSNTGNANIDVSSTLQSTGTGNITLSPAGTGQIKLAANLTTQGGNINLNGGTTLLSSVTVNSGSGTITFANGITGAYTLTLQNASSASGAVIFNGNLNIDNLITFAQPYSISFNGSDTTIAQALIFANTNGITLGNDSSDTLNFTNGLTYSAGTATLNGTLNTTNTPISLSAITLAGNSAINTSGADLTIGTLSGTPNNLTLNTGSTGNITFNGNGNIGALTITNVNNLTNNATLTVTSYTQNTGNITFLGTHTLIVNGGNATITSSTINGNVVLSSGNVTLNASSVNTSLTTPGNATVTANTYTGTVNVGGLSINISQSMNISGSVGGATGVAAIANMNFISPAPGNFFFDGIDIAVARTAANSAIVKDLFLPYQTTETSLSTSNALITYNMGTTSEAEEGLFTDSSHSMMERLATQSSIINAMKSTSALAIPQQSIMQAALFNPAMKAFASYLPNEATLSETLTMNNALPRIVTTFARIFAAPIITTDTLLASLAAMLTIIAAFFASLFQAISRTLIHRSSKDWDNVYASFISTHLQSSLIHMSDYFTMMMQLKFGKITEAQRELIQDMMVNTKVMHEHLSNELASTSKKTPDSMKLLSYKVRSLIDTVNQLASIIQTGQAGKVTFSMREALEAITGYTNELQKSLQDLAAYSDSLGKSSFFKNASVLSFNLRTSLNNISGFAEMLLLHPAGTLGLQQKESLRYVLESASDINRFITNDLESRQSMSPAALSNMSFKLRSGLDSILGFSQLMYDEKLGRVSTEQKKFLAYMISSSRETLLMLNDMSSSVESEMSTMLPTKVLFY